MGVQNPLVQHAARRVRHSLIDQHPALARRLRVESLECRHLLSISPYDFAPFATLDEDPTVSAAQGSPGDSSGDNNDSATFSDDRAIAPDKTGYLPGGGNATFTSVSSYTLGINGIMVDFSLGHGTITANDFMFKVGNNNSPTLWASGPAPTAVTTRVGAGVSGSDRVELIWEDNAIEKTWLEVIVNGNDALGGWNTNTGLASSYVFYFGNALADSGAGDPSSFLVSSADEQSARNDPHGPGNPATVSNVNDFNRDGLVNSVDQQAVRNNITSPATALKFLNVGAGGPFGPASEASNEHVSGPIAGPLYFFGTQVVSTKLFYKGSTYWDVPPPPPPPPGQPDVRMDSNNDGQITSADDAVEATPPGKLILLRQSAADALTPAQIGVVPNPGGTLTIHYPSFLRVYANSNRTGLIASGAQVSPATVYVEGVGVGAGSINVVCTLNDQSRSDAVYVTVVNVNLTIDSNNDGTINSSDDATEDQSPGKFVELNQDDDDHNGAEDRVDPGPTFFDDDDLVPVNLGLSASALDGFQTTLDSTSGSNRIRIWTTATKSLEITLPVSWAVEDMPSTVFVEGIASGDVMLRLTLTNASAYTFGVDSVRLCVDFVDMQAYLPTTEFFQRGPAEKDVYIRRNGDDDNQNSNPDWNDGAVQNENDLIELTLKSDLASPNLRYVLARSTHDINVWRFPTKSSPIFTIDQDEVEITFDSGIPETVWVEWVTPGTGGALANLHYRIESPQSNSILMQSDLAFRPFTSVVIVLGGEFQSPSDPANSNEGTFASAIDLYKNGYDVHMFDEDTVEESGYGAPFNEVVSAIESRGVTHVGVFGYSHGGGATYLLAAGLSAVATGLPAFTVEFTAYIDAIRSIDLFAEVRRPPLSIWHLNIFQTNDSVLQGASMSNADDDKNAALFAYLNHTTVDDNTDLRLYVQAKLKEHLPNR